MMAEATVYLIRHGQTDGNALRIMDGHHNLPLNSVGIQQAKQAGDRLKDVAFTAAYTSDLDRAAATAAAVMDANVSKGLAIEPCILLRERHLGRFEGHPWSEFDKWAVDRVSEEDPEFLEANGSSGMVFFRRAWKLTPEKGESVEAMRRRSAQFIRLLKSDMKEYYTRTGRSPCVLVASHGGTLKELLTHLLDDLSMDVKGMHNPAGKGGVDPREQFSPNTGVTIIHIPLEEGGRGQLRCSMLNCGEHIGE